MTARCAPLLAALLLGFSSLASAAGARWAVFPGLPTAPAGAAASPASSTTFRGYLAEPEDPRGSPGVVLLHGCDGVHEWHLAWARTFASRGHVALVPDAATSPCHGHDAGHGVGHRARRVQAALGALRFLAWHPGVDRRRLAAVGWGDAPVMDLVDGTGTARGYPRALGAAAVLPAPCAPPIAAREIPVLSLDVASADAGCAVGGPTATDGAAAHGAGLEAVATFLESSLRRRRSPRWTGASAAPVEAGAATWLISPDEPGPDLPPTGASTFDTLFAVSGPGGLRHELPFPFARLLARLRERYPEPTVGAPAWSSVLIPYGRSLQRAAAAPDHARSPRVVVAATGDAGPGASVDARDRVFLAYQPRAAVIEVISFNEGAGRFEFQLVRDYGPTQHARVLYPHRTLCVRCHQNQAPIFAGAGWSETNSDPEMADHLAPLGAMFEGVRVAGVQTMAAAIDVATDRASALATMQPVWRDGCGAGVDGARCRGAALLAMVGSRLGAAPQALADALAERLTRRATALWPDGVLVPDAGLPDRAPLLSATPQVVLPEHEPLARRAPAARWAATDPRLPAALVAGLAPALPAADVERIERHLTRPAPLRPNHEPGLDLAPLDAAVRSLVEDAAAQPGHPLGHGPFRARALTAALLRALGAPVAAGCCEPG